MIFIENERVKTFPNSNVVPCFEIETYFLICYIYCNWLLWYQSQILEGGVGLPISTSSYKRYGNEKSWNADLIRYSQLNSSNLCLPAQKET